MLHVPLYHDHYIWCLYNKGSVPLKLIMLIFNELHRLNKTNEYTFASLSIFCSILWCHGTVLLHYTNAHKCKNHNVSPSIYLKKSHCFHFKNESHLSSLSINHTRLPFVDGAKEWRKMDLVSLFCRITYRTCILCINDWFEVGGGECR